MTLIMLIEQLRNLPACSYRVSVKALIRDDIGRVLVVKEGDDYWDLPGGGTEHSEDLSISLQREVIEETGLAVDVGKLYDSIKFQSVDGIQALFIIYECQPKTMKIALGDASESAWLAPEKLTDWPLYLIKGFGI